MTQDDSSSAPSPPRRRKIPTVLPEQRENEHKYVCLYFPAGLHAAVKLAAKRRGYSTSRFICETMKRALVFDAQLTEAIAARTATPATPKAKRGQKAEVEAVEGKVEDKGVEAPTP